MKYEKFLVKSDVRERGNENVKYEKFLESEKCGAAEVESPRMADAAFQQN